MGVKPRASSLIIAWSSDVGVDVGGDVAPEVAVEVALEMAVDVALGMAGDAGPETAVAVGAEVEFVACGCWPGWMFVVMARDWHEKCLSAHTHTDAQCACET